MIPTFRLVIIALVSLGLTGCAHAFLRKGLDGGNAELHGVSSIGLGALRITTTYSHVPPWNTSGLSDHGVRNRRRVASEIAAVSVAGVCDEVFVSGFATALMTWTTALHGILAWNGQAEIRIHIGAAKGVHRRNHLSKRSGAPRVTFWLPGPPSCAVDEVEAWRLTRLATVVHELAHVVARDAFDNDLDSESFAHVVQICTDYAMDGVVDSWPANLRLAAAEWSELATGEPDLWIRFVSRTGRLPASAAAAVLATANFRAFDYPDPPGEVVGEICDAYMETRPSLRERMIVPSSWSDQT